MGFNKCLFNCIWALLLSFYASILYSQEEIDSMYYNPDSYDYYQDTVYHGWLGILDFEIKKPVSPMNDKFDALSAGFSIGVFKQVSSILPLYAGGGLYYSNYADNGVTYYAVNPDDGYEYEYEESLSGDVLGVYAGTKYFFQKSFWRFNMYTGLNLHFRYAFAVVRTTNLDLDETINTDFKGGNSGFGYELNAGTLIYVGNDNMFIDFSISYEGGGGLFLYTKKHETPSSDFIEDYYDYKYVPLSFVKINFGIAISR